MTKLPPLAARALKCYRVRKIAEAAYWFRVSVDAGEDPEPAALERWMAFMTAAEFELAWRESDRVLARRRARGETCEHLPQHYRWLWDGEPLEGRRVMVRCYHGLGDTIQFARLLPELRARCRDVQFVPQPELAELLPPIVTGPYDAQIELMEVPHALRLTVDRIPAAVPYVSVQGPERVPRGGWLRVGLAWASGAWRPERSVPLSLFGFFDELNVELTGLQRGEEAFRRPLGSPSFRSTEWENRSISATAQTIRGLDLVISTDTMVAHLAGALAVPVWTLLPWESDWRWLDGREDSPWYPTMRLFRQPELGNWTAVVERVREELTRQCQQVNQNQAGGGKETKGAQAP